MEAHRVWSLLEFTQRDQTNDHHPSRMISKPVFFFTIKYCAASGEAEGAPSLEFWHLGAAPLSGLMAHPSPRTRLCSPSIGSRRFQCLSSHRPMRSPCGALQCGSHLELPFLSPDPQAHTHASLVDICASVYPGTSGLYYFLVTSPRYPGHALQSRGLTKACLTKS